MLKSLRLLSLALCAWLLPTGLHAASPEEINLRVNQGLRILLSSNPTARALASQAVAILVFPKIVKGGFIVGGQFGEGALIEDNTIVGYYSTAAASLGYQAGLERYGYALFFMNNDALAYLKKSRGWSLGAGPTLVVLDKGVNKNFSTATAKSDVYACAFNERGLMGGVGIQGAKITHIHPH